MPPQIEMPKLLAMLRAQNFTLSRTRDGWLAKSPKGGSTSFHYNVKSTRQVVANLKRIGFKIPE